MASKLVRSIQKHCTLSKWEFGTGKEAVNVSIMTLHKDSPLWRVGAREVEKEHLWGVDGPYWLWVWPGAYGICSSFHTLQPCDVFVDFGCGGGIIGHLAVRSGLASVVVFNDIDPIALVAATMGGFAQDGDKSYIHELGHSLESVARLAEHQLSCGEAFSTKLPQLGNRDVETWIESANLLDHALDKDPPGGEGGTSRRLRVTVAVGDVMYDVRSAEAVCSWAEELVKGTGTARRALLRRPWMPSPAPQEADLEVSVVAASPLWPAARDCDLESHGWRRICSLGLPPHVNELCHGLDECVVWELGEAFARR